MKKNLIDIPGTQVLWLFLTSLYTYKLKEVKVKINKKKTVYFFFLESICSLLITAVDDIEYDNIQPHVQICSKLL